MRPARALHVSDMDILAENLLAKQYRLSEVVENGDVIVDIGAHIGIFAIMAAQMRVGVKVFAYEPETDNFALLVDNVKLNPKLSITIFNKAVSTQNTKKRLYLSCDNTGAHSLFGHGNKCEIVECVNLGAILDALPDKRIDLLKLDCEGSEFEILMNATAKELQSIQRIIMEVHETTYTSCYRTDALLKRLATEGFSVNVYKTIRYSDEGVFHMVSAKRKRLLK
jgi:FkbM family methyltransferase